MNSLLFTVMLSGAVLAADPAPKAAPAKESLDAASEGYEHLATVIIEVRKAEDAVVKNILIHHHQAAQQHLQTAQSGNDVQKHLEAAAAEVANVANEGDKRVQAVRQRLAKAGHTHHSDADTKEDYVFINSKEKKGLLDSAKSIAKLGAKATANDVSAAAKSLESAFNKAITPE